MIAGALRDSAFNRAIQKPTVLAPRVRRDAWDTVPGEGWLPERKRNEVLMGWLGR